MIADYNTNAPRIPQATRRRKTKLPPLDRTTPLLKPQANQQRRAFIEQEAIAQSQAGVNLLESAQQQEFVIHSGP